MTFSTSVAPLRYAPFRSLWLASVASNVGSFVQTVAASWLMQELTGSPLWVSAMAASGTLPLLFLALPAGALADILDRRKVMLVSQVVMGIAATAMAALAFLELLNPPLLLGLGLLLGVGVAFNLPAWQAMVPDLVPRELVANAVALNSVAFNVARAVGPAIGGLLVAAAGAGWAFLINSLSFLAVIIAVARLHWSEPAEPEVSSVASAIGLGVRFARFTPPFRRLLAVAALFALTSGVVQSLLATLTEESLDAGAFAYGALLGAMGAGASARCLHPRRRCRTVGGASRRGGGHHLRACGDRRRPGSRSVAGRHRALHRRDRMGVDAGHSQRHRPAAGPGVGEGSGGVALHAWPLSASFLWERCWRVRSGRRSGLPWRTWCWVPAP